MALQRHSFPFSHLHLLMSSFCCTQLQKKPKKKNNLDDGQNQSVCLETHTRSLFPTSSPVLPIAIVTL